LREARLTALRAKAAVEDDHYRATITQHPKGPTAAELSSVSSVALDFLNVLPLSDMGFWLPRHEFRDALKLLYDLPVTDLPSEPCSCQGAPAFTQGHSQMCRKGGWIVKRHNALRDLLHDFCSVVAPSAIEPKLHALDPADTFSLKTTNTDPNARSDLLVEGLYGALQATYIDVRVVYRNAPFHCSRTVEQLLALEEKTKCREYRERIQRVEGGSFSPFVATSNGILGKQAHELVQHVGNLMADHTREPIGATLTMMRAQLSLCFVRAALHCLRGPRTQRKPSTLFLATSALYAAWASRASQ
jgi:hypothetical protein